MKRVYTVTEATLTLTKIEEGVYSAILFADGDKVRLALKEKYALEVFRDGRWMWTWGGLEVDSLDDLAMAICETGIERAIVTYN